MSMEMAFGVYIYRIVVVLRVQMEEQLWGKSGKDLLIPVVVISITCIMKTCCFFFMGILRERR